MPDLRLPGRMPTFSHIFDPAHREFPDGDGKNP